MKKPFDLREFLSQTSTRRGPVWKRRMAAVKPTPPETEDVEPAPTVNAKSADE